MTEEEKTEAFIELMTEFQGPLYAYIFSMIGHQADAQDVLQESNMVLMTKSDQFTLGTSFRAWSFCIANFQVMAWRKRCKRDRLVFDDELALQLSSEIQSSCSTYNEDLETLRKCILKLNDRHRELIEKRYRQGLSVKVIAAALEQPANTFAQVIHRARQALINCVSRNSGAEA